MIRWKLRLTRIAQPTLRGALTLTLTLTRVATDDGTDDVAHRTYPPRRFFKVVVATTAPPQYHALPRYHHLNYLMQWRDEGLIHKVIPVDNSIIMEKIHDNAARMGPVGAGIVSVRTPKGIPRPHEQHAGLPRKLPQGRDTGDTRVPQISEARARTEGFALSI